MTDNLNWFQKIIQRAIGVHAKEDISGALRVSSVGGGPEAHPYDPDVHAHVYAIEVWAMACMRAIAEAIASIPLQVVERRIRNSEEVLEPVEGGPLNDLLTNPNINEPFNDLLKTLVVRLLSTGDGYIHFDERANELWGQQSEWMKVILSRDGAIMGYEATNNGHVRKFAPEEILHFKLLNPESSFYGVPPSAVVRRTVLTKLALQGYIHRYFTNNALIGTTLSTDRTLTAEQRAQMRQELDRLHKGYENSFKVAIMDGGVKLDKLSHTLKDLMPTDLYRALREETLAAYGVPHVVVGVLDDASYANADIQKQLFYELRVLPFIQSLEDVLNKDLAPRFGDKIQLRWDRAQIKALREDEVKKAQRLVSLVNAGIWTPNEARIEYQMEPIEGGDEVRGPMSFGLPPGEEDPEDKPEEKPGDKPKKPDEEKPEKRRIIVPTVKRRKTAAWEYHHAQVAQAEKEFAAIMRAYFDHQLERVSRNLLTIGGGRDRFSSALLFAELHRKPGQKINGDDTTAIFNTLKENERLRRVTEPKMRSEANRAGMQAISQIDHQRRGISPFRVDAPEVFSLIERAQNRISLINDTTFEDIKGVLAMAYDEGWGIARTEKEIRATYDGFSKMRATRIAQTEMNGVVNGGFYEGYKQGGATEKFWISAQLPTSRSWHIEAEAQGGIPIDEPFQVGNSLMMFPSDPSGLPEDVINCHCSVVAA